MPAHKARTLKPAIDAVEILHRRFYEVKPTRLGSLEETRANEEIARTIRELRTAAGLTQTQLARLIGTAAVGHLRDALNRILHATEFDSSSTAARPKYLISQELRFRKTPSDTPLQAGGPPVGRRGIRMIEAPAATRHHRPGTPCPWFLWPHCETRNPCR